MYQLFFSGKLQFFHTFDETTAEQLRLKENSITILMPEIYHSKYEDKVFRYNKVCLRGIYLWLEVSTTFSVIITNQSMGSSNDIGIYQHTLLKGREHLKSFSVTFLPFKDLHLTFSCFYSLQIHSNNTSSSAYVHVGTSHSFPCKVNVAPSPHHDLHSNFHHSIHSDILNNQDDIAHPCLNACFQFLLHLSLPLL